MEKQYTYYAFISYRGADVKWAKWFVKKSDAYLLPTITPEDVKAGNRAPVLLKDDDKYLYPVFRDRDNLKSGHLLDQILTAIDASRKIVVLCTSTAAQKGSWMDDELRHIIDTGRIDQIIPLVIEGRIYSVEDYEAANRSIEDPFPDDSNPYVLRQYMKEHREHAAAINYIEFEEQGIRNPERAFIKCVASIIDMPFENLWNRFGKEQKRKARLRRLYCTLAVAVTIIVGIATWLYNQPVDIKMKIYETTIHNYNLPPLKDAVVSMTVEGVTETDTIASLESEAIFEKVPKSDIGKEAHITVSCKDFLPIDTFVTLSEFINLNIDRDIEPYGNIRFLLWDANTEKGVSGIAVTIAGISSTTDDDGRFEIHIPLEKQQQRYRVSCGIPLENDILIMPTTESTILLMK